MMDFFGDIPFSSLEQCSYRHLQQLAKNLGLPSNVKKVYLMEMLYAKKHNTPEQLASLVDYIKEQRKQLAKPRKTIVKRRKRVQGAEISTSNPPICSTLIHHWSNPVYIPLSKPTRKYTNTNAFIQKRTIKHGLKKQAMENDLPKQAEESDPLKRTEESDVSKQAEGRVFSLQAIEIDLQTRMRESDPSKRFAGSDLPKRTIGSDLSKRVIESDRVLRSYYNRSQRNNYANIENMGVAKAKSVREPHEKQYEWDMQLQRYRPIGVSNNLAQRQMPHNTNAVVKSRPIDPNKRQTEVFERDKQLVPYASSSVPARRERRISGIYPLESTHMYYQSTNHVGIRKKEGLVTLNAIVRTSLRHPQTVLKNKITQANIQKRPIQKIISGTVQPKTVQNLYRKEFSHSSTESARESSSDVEMKSRTTKSFQGSCEDVAFSEMNPRQLNIDYSIENFVNNQAEISHAGNFPKAFPMQIVHAINRSESSKRKLYVIDNQKRANNITAIDNQSKMAVNKLYATDNQTKRIDTKNITENRNTRALRVFTNPCKISIKQNQRKDLAIHSEHFDIINITKDEIDHANLDLNITAESLKYSDNSKMGADINQNSVPINTDRNEDYPNMSALTDVYPENHVEVISEASETDNSTVYYHKKIRAEQVRTRRLSASLERRHTNTLPHIDEVFSKLREPRFRHLMQPLYVHCGDDAMITPARVQESNNGALESLYNYAAPSRSQPLDFHHVVVTTCTKSTYTSHFTTTPAACESPSGCAQCYNSLQRDKQRNTNLLSILGLQDYQTTQNWEDVTCDEMLEQSPTAGPSAPREDTPLSGAASIEEALDLISQDGDYMERIGMDARMQCILCEWAGPRSILQYHVELEHLHKIISRPSPDWCSVVSLAGVRSGARELSKYDDRVYVLSAACGGTERFRARITMLPKDESPDDLPIHAHLSVYSKTTGRPQAWEGVIAEVHSSPDGNETMGLDVHLSDLDLLPNGSLKLENGQWVVDSEIAEVCQVDVNDIEIVVHVQIYI